MLFESAHVRVTAEYGVASLWLAFPGSPVNALDGARLNELDAALAAIEPNPFLHALVVRSAKPAGFCAGLHPSVAEVADRSALAARGQRTCARLASLPFTTIAFIDGPCLGAGLELALACDHRLCVATPLTLLGFPDRFTCFGGGTRLRGRIGRRAAAFVESGRTLSGREARDCGLVDRAFCARRTRIDLRTFLDQLERSRRVPDRARDETGSAHERRAFVRADLSGLGRPVAGPTDTGVLLARGFITPLEAEPMRARASAAEPVAAPADPLEPALRRVA
ncbi:enoyl-CoA hydratase/isomerase family protein [Frigoriglobus tundricola]|uniref:Fatty acid oxidation complex subunit alpha n=1 Tax=Frigoriglobus tundricola TaxID=2774151 RepID=A0A6M5YMY8_9BACT|nr:enoyl-CoA hydratase/isomerase family protein [Frigoriglobus tundricola]QJW94312.1 Fatty acid oxidation complex subunit alpha [Frigoriglobus tundricola]